MTNTDKSITDLVYIQYNNVVHITFNQATYASVHVYDQASEFTPRYMHERSTRCMYMCMTKHRKFEMNMMRPQTELEMSVCVLEQLSK